MSFREKSAWITALTVLLCFGLYFASIAAGLLPRFGMKTFHYGLVCVVALVVLQAVFHFVAARTSPEDAKAPLDERERMFGSRARSIGYYLLTIWMLAIIAGLHFPNFDKLDLIYLAMMGVVVSILTVAFAQIIQFRRGA